MLCGAERGTSEQVPERDRHAGQGVVQPVVGGDQAALGQGDDGVHLEGTTVGEFTVKTGGKARLHLTSL